jgi:hypothetical protein
MKKKILLLGLLLLISVKIFSQDTSRNITQFRTVQNTAFGIGEYLRFEINYGFITAGDAVMSVAPAYTTINGRNAYAMSFNVNSTSAFNVVYNVKDRYTSIVDAQGLFPWRFEQHIREGNFQRDFEAVFDQENLKVKTYTGESEPKKFEGEYAIPMYVQDALSAFYFGRTLNYNSMKVGDVVNLQNFYKDQTYPLDIRYLGKETIEVPAGEFRCIKVEPLVREGGLFKSEGSMVLWMTDDDRKMPVKVKTAVVIGSVDADLIEYRGLSGPLNSKQ